MLSLLIVPTLIAFLDYRRTTCSEEVPETPLQEFCRIYNLVCDEQGIIWMTPGTNPRDYGDKLLLYMLWVVMFVEQNGKVGILLKNVDRLQNLPVNVKFPFLYNIYDESWNDIKVKHPHLGRY